MYQKNLDRNRKKNFKYKNSTIKSFECLSEKKNNQIHKEIIDPYIIWCTIKI